MPWWLSDVIDVIESLATPLKGQLPPFSDVIDVIESLVTSLKGPLPPSADRLADYSQIASFGC